MDGVVVFLFRVQTVAPSALSVSSVNATWVINHMEVRQILRRVKAPHLRKKTDVAFITPLMGSDSERRVEM